jgi:hypothetical protein
MSVHKQKKRGRPLSLNPASSRVDFRLTPDEKKEWQGYADAMGWTLSEWIKAVLRDSDLYRY